MALPHRLLLALAPLLVTACSATGDAEHGEEEHERRPKAHLDSMSGALLSQALAQSMSSKRPSATTPASTPPPTGTASTFDGELPMSYFSDWEPAVACSRDGKYVYQSTTRYGDPNAFSQPHLPLRISTDGGQTWQPDQYIENTRAWEADPQIAVSDDGTVFVVWLSLFTPGVSFKKSSDHGRTWTAPIALAPKSASFPSGWSDKPWLVVHPNGQDLFVGFNSSDPYVVVSHDGGATWTAPIQTASNGRYWYHTGGCVAPNGDIHFATADYRFDFGGPTYVNVTSSTDNGATWSNTRIDTSDEMPGCGSVPGCYFGFLGPQSSIACDAAGTLMYVWNAGVGRRRPQKLWFSTSTDGVNWSTRQQISVAPNAVHNGFPAVATSSTPGDFRVVWQDTRMAGTWNTWFKETRDGGASWSNDVRLSHLDVPVVYKSSLGYDFVFGDYLGLAVDQFGTNHVIWGEGANYNGPGHTWFTRGW